MIDFPNILNKFPFMPLKFIGNLFYFEGSLISVFSDEFREPVIFRWVGCDKIFNRWLVYKVKETDLHKYLDKEITQFELICSNTLNQYLLVDIDKDKTIRNTFSLSLEDIPSNYLPDPGIYFKDDDTEDIETIKEYFNLSGILTENGNSEKITYFNQE